MKADVKSSKRSFNHLVHLLSIFETCVGLHPLKMVMSPAVTHTFAGIGLASS